MYGRTIQKSRCQPSRSDIPHLFIQYRIYQQLGLVDLSAAQIVGCHLEEKDHAPLYRLAQSSLIWEQRISIVSTWQWIRKGRFDDTLAIADILLYNKHDLIRKAVGWMLREVGKKDKTRLCTFLDTRYRDMPRTMLRYAIEKFPPEERRHYMQK